MEKIIKLQEEIDKKQRKVRKGCIEYLKKVVKKAGGTICMDDEEDVVIVAYDGGRHPEDDSNLYSAVESVFLKDGKLYLSIEDCDEYEINRVDTDEVYAVAVFVYNMVMCSSLDLIWFLFR